MLQIYLSVVLLCLFLLGCRRKIYRKVTTVDGRRLEDVSPSVPGYPIFGNYFDVVLSSFSDIFKYFRQQAAVYKKSYFLNFFSVVVYNVIKAEDAELILTSQTLLSKEISYDMLLDFLGTGLLTSTGKKWHSRRKLLTPAFHFSILQKFLDIFKQESVKFVNFLNTQENGSVICLTDVIPRFTLNNVCEAALGVNLDELKVEGDNYRKNMSHLDAVLTKRISNPLLYTKLAFKLFGNAKEYYAAHEKVHSFSSDIIKRRRSLFDITHGLVENDEYMKPRHAMLDTLLEAEKEGLIDHSGICEEVDTFMFEGYDTTSNGLTYTFLLLALNPDAQQKLFEEIVTYEEHLSTPNIQGIADFKYLDCVIKESLRMFPSVPAIGRQLTEDMTFGNLRLPSGSQVLVHVFDMHYDPKWFPNPHEFNPDRFLPENTVNRHPFAYVPFSAGPRNCIGQKFAMLEMKMLIMHVIRDFILSPVTQIDEIENQVGLVLRSTTPIKIKISKRQRNN